MMVVRSFAMLSVLALPTGMGRAGVPQDAPQKDEVILKSLLAAQQAAGEAFPTGMLRATAESPSQGRFAKVLNIWDESHLYVEADTWEVPRGSVVDLASISDPARRVFQIHSENESIFLTTVANTLQIVKGNRVTGWRILKLRPRDIWFNYSPPDSLTWTGVLESCLEGGASGFQWYVERHPDGVIELIREYPAQPSTLRVKFDLQRGGNVIAFDQRGAGIIRTGQMEWTEVDGDRWFLRRYLARASVQGDEDFRHGMSYRVIVTDFDPAPEIPENQFRKSNLPLRPGMIVQELGTELRTWRLGENGESRAPISDDKFRELADWLRGNGFAAEDRRND